MASLSEAHAKRRIAVMSARRLGGEAEGASSQRERSGDGAEKAPVSRPVQERRRCPARDRASWS